MKLLEAVEKITKSIFGTIAAVQNYRIKAFKAYENFINKQDEGVKKLLGPWEEINVASSKFAKNIGMSSKAMGEFRDKTNKLIEERQLGVKYGVSAEELMQQMQGIYGTTGRKVGISNADTEEISGMTAVIGAEKTQEYISKLDAFGVSMSDASKLSGKMFAKASKAGINFQKYSENFLKNIQKAQTYNFKNGVKGVETMAKKATELKFSIEEAAKFSDKVNSLEGALNAGAQLQALGGSFAQFSNPLEMLNESYTSTEDMYERMVNMMGGHGKFNTETGEVEVNGMDKKRIRLASEAMGVSYEQMMEGIHNKGRRDEIGKQLGNRSDLSQEMKDLIMNTGTFKNGRAGIIDENGEFKDVSKITNDDQKKLLALNKTESEDIKDIAMNLRTITDVVAGRHKDKRSADAAQDKVIQKAEKLTDRYTSERYQKRIRRQNKRLARKRYKAGKAERQRDNIAAIAGFAEQIDAGVQVAGAPFQPFVKKAEGGPINSGKVNGPSHESGGVKYVTNKGMTPYELEGGEYVINKNSTNTFLPIIEEINKSGNGSNNREILNKILRTIIKMSPIGIMGGVIKNIITNNKEGGNRNSYFSDNSTNIKRIGYFEGAGNSAEGIVKSIGGNNTFEDRLKSISGKLLKKEKRMSLRQLNEINKIFEVTGTTNRSEVNNIINNKEENAGISSISSTGSNISPNVSKMNPEPVAPIVTSNPVEEKGTTSSIKMEPLNINFSGSIRLEGKNGSSVDITKDLLESGQFIKKITEEIEKQLGTNKYGKTINKSIIQ